MIAAKSMRATFFSIIGSFLTIMTASAEESNKWKKPEGEPLFVAISKDNEEMNQAFQTAKSTLPQFLKAIRSPCFASSTSAVKIKIRDEQHSKDLGEDRFAYLWVWNVKEEGNDLRASVVELPKGGINDLAVGKDVIFSREKVYDWMITEGPKAWGAFTMRVVRSRMEQKERTQYDEYTGISIYSEDLP